jgi:hypothetical protein
LRHPDGRFSSVVVPWVDPVTGRAVSVLADGQEPVLDPQHQRDLLDLLARRRSAGPRASGVRGGEARYLLTGLLRCAHCGGRMSASGNSYRCHAVRTGHLCDEPAGVYIPALDEAVTGEVVARLGSEAASASLRLIATSSPDEHPADWFARAGLAERRRVLAALVQHVSVTRGRRGRRFDARARVQVSWHEVPAAS